jgi:hypothetical protein
MTAGVSSVDLWDFLKGERLRTFPCQVELSPISLTLVKENHGATTFLLQNKNGLIVVVIY